MLKIPKGVRVGHGGTLDPFASGLLVVGVAREYTRQLHEVLVGMDKTYLVEIMVGGVSDTDDRTGQIERRSCSSDASYESVHEAIEELKKREFQIPPQYSAIKLRGKKAYEIARSGGVSELGSRKTSLISYELLRAELSENGYFKVVIRLVVSSGFYVRSFARDLGELLGGGAYVQELRRERIGPYDVSDATSVEALEAEDFCPVSVI